jgi:hypothetical protein
VWSLGASARPPRRGDIPPPPPRRPQPRVAVITVKSRRAYERSSAHSTTAISTPRNEHRSCYTKRMPRTAGTAATRAPSRRSDEELPDRRVDGSPERRSENLASSVASSRSGIRATAQSRTWSSARGGVASVHAERNESDNTHRPDGRRGTPQGYRSGQPEAQT